MFCSALMPSHQPSYNKAQQAPLQGNFNLIVADVWDQLTQTNIPVKAREEPYIWHICRQCDLLIIEAHTYSSHERHAFALLSSMAVYARQCKICYHVPMNFLETKSCPELHASPKGPKAPNCSGAGSAAPRSTKFWAVYKHYDVDVCTYTYYSDILAKQSTLPGSRYVV